MAGAKPSGADRNRTDDRQRKHRPKPAGNEGEDDEIRKAIELSKLTA